MLSAAMLLMLATQQYSPERIYPCQSASSSRSDVATDTLLIRSAHQLADRYQPVLYFYKDEEYVPTMPFLAAFDGIDNNNNGRIDFADPDEIAGSGHTNIPWDSLDAKHRLNGNARSADRQFVFYRVWCTNETETYLVRRFLKKDPQAWRRFGMEARWPDDDEQTELVVIEYYFYYVNDRGLEGHAEDIEFAFVFVPNDTSLSRAFRVVVGAGHSPRTPNGVLVTREPDQRTYGTVEFGGHATTPLVSQADEFRYGIDVNWHVADTWGPRDIMAISGLGYKGQYLAELSLTRRNAIEYNRARNDRNHYRLLPAAQFKLLFDRVRADDAAGVHAALSAIGMVWEGTAFHVPAVIDTSTIERMKVWLRGFRLPDGHLNPAGRHQVWLHRAYNLSPTIILKDHLYRPAQWYGWDLLTWGVNYLPSETIAPYVGAVIPVGYLPLYLAGFLEFDAGIAIRSRGSGWTPFASATYDTSYRDMLSWFTRITYTPKTSEELGISAPDVSLTFGPSLLLWSSDTRNTYWKTQLTNAIRIRVGPRIYFHTLDNVFSRAAAEFSVAFRQ